jgi:hypothetical protein
MVRRLKAVADVMLLIGMAFGIFLLLFDFTPFWYEGDTYRVLLHTHMYGMSNALDAAGLYVNISLDYSVYQALYQTLGSGGFETIESGKGRDGIAYWSDSSSAIQIPTKEQVGEALRKRIEENLAKYTGAGYSFTYDYGVRLPGYKVSLQEESGGFRITTSSDDANMSISKYTQEYGMKEDVTIKRPLLPEALYDIDYGGMLEIGSSENPGIVSALQDAVNAGVDSWPKESDAPLDDNALKALGDSLRNSIESSSKLVFERDLGDYTLKSFIHDIHKSSSSEQNAQGKYSNSYDVTAILKVSVIYNKEDFPVYDSSQKKVVIDKIGLVFLDRFNYKSS